MEKLLCVLLLVEKKIIMLKVVLKPSLSFAV